MHHSHLVPLPFGLVYCTVYHEDFNQISNKKIQTQNDKLELQEYPPSFCTGRGVEKDVVQRYWNWMYTFVSECVFFRKEYKILKFSFV